MKRVRGANGRERIETGSVWEEKMGYSRAMKAGPLITVAGCVGIVWWRRPVAGGVSFESLDFHRESSKPNEPYEIYYNNSMIKIVEDFYRKDLDLLDYKF